MAPRILEAVTAEGYDTPTPIQAESIPPILAGRDMLGCAQTGTGKTAAFALPVLHHLHTAKVDKKKRGPVLPRALILSPTRELATQIAESFSTYGHGTGLRLCVIFGGVKQNPQVRRLQGGADIIVATPGRLLDLMNQGHVNLSAVKHFVLDEADRMLDMGFIDPIRKVCKKLPADRQTLMFSATMPTDIAKLAGSILTDPVKVAVTPVASAAPKIEQSLFMAEQPEKIELLRGMLSDRSVERAIVFTRTKHGANKLTEKLERSRVTAVAIHGNKSQNQRQKALDAFRDGRSRVLVATDVAARGLDVDGITHVFNFNLPNEPEAYVHRIGRTGRAGAVGSAVSFCSKDERSYLRAIERLIGEKLPRGEAADVSVPDAAVEAKPQADAGAVAQAKRKPRPKTRTDRKSKPQRVMPEMPESGEYAGDQPALMGVRPRKPDPRSKPAAASRSGAKPKSKSNSKPRARVGGGEQQGAAPSGERGRPRRRKPAGTGPARRSGGRSGGRPGLGAGSKSRSGPSAKG
ncbi:MAG: DEAD/DEAH box helicase [Planctomycetota bacterium]